MTVVKEEELSSLCTSELWDALRHRQGFTAFCGRDSMSRRVEQINRLLREEISNLVANGVKDPRLVGVVTITHVDTSADLHHARVFTSVLGTDAEKWDALEGLRSASGFLRRELRHNRSLRVVPQLQFIQDDSIEHGAYMLDVMNRLSPQGPTSDA